MERLSILVDGDTVCMDDLPRKILDQVGDVSLLPPVEEDAPACEPEAEPLAEPTADDGVEQTPAPAPQVEAAIPVAASGAFVWPQSGCFDCSGTESERFS